MLYHLDVVAGEGLSMEKTQNQLMTVADVIAAMGISRSTWQKLVAQKRTPPIAVSYTHLTLPTSDLV